MQSYQEISSSVSFSDFMGSLNAFKAIHKLKDVLVQMFHIPVITLITSKLWWDDQFPLLIREREEIVRVEGIATYPVNICQLSLYPTYLYVSCPPMNFFSWVMQHIDSIWSWFRWKGTVRAGKELHLVRWDKVCRRKRYEGMKIVNLLEMNIALCVNGGEDLSSQQRRMVQAHSET